MLKKIILLLALLPALAFAQLTLPGAQYAYDSNGSIIGTLTPANVNGFAGFVPPTDDYAGIMKALRSAIASPTAKNVLFKDKTYNIGSNYIPIVGGITYVGHPWKLAYSTGYLTKNPTVVSGTIISSTNTNGAFWDGAVDLAAVTGNIANQSTTTTSGSTTLVVPNGALFTVGQRVYVPASGAGFYTGISYYVLSVSGNNITLGLPDMVAIAATASTTINIAAGYPNDGTTNVEIRNFACVSVTTCIRMGAKNTFGPIYSKIDNIFVAGNVSYPTIFLTNWEGIFVSRINTANGNGQYYGGNFSSGAYIPGNSWFSGLVNANNGTGSTSINQQGVVFQSENGTNLNQVHVLSAQNNNFYISTVTQTSGALTNGSANIPVSDSTKFNVNVPVWISTAANPNGFTTNICYWVVSSAANVIQLAATKGGAAINSTGTATMVINTQGFPGFEMVGIGTGTIGNSDANELDIEANSTALMLFQHANVQVNSVLQAAASDGHFTLAARSASGSANLLGSATTDFDSGSASFGVAGQRSSGNSAGFAGIGQYFDSSIGSGVQAWNLHSNNSVGFPSLYAVSQGNTSWIRAATPIGEKLLAADTSKTFGNAVDAGISIYNGASGQTGTLPIIVNTSASNTNVGERWTILNASTTNAYTVASQSSQTFNDQTGVTSYTLQPGQWARFTGAIDSSANLFWETETDRPTTGALTGNSVTIGSGSTTSAGLITQYSGVSGYGAIYSTGVTPSTTNYGFWTNGANTSLNGSTANYMKVGGTAIFGFGNNSLFAAGNTANVLINQLLPTISSGCGTSPSISSISTAASAITIGTSPGSTCTLTMPTAAHGWACQATDITTQFDTKQTATSTTSVTFTNYTRGTTTPVSFTASDVVQAMCLGY